MNLRIEMKFIALLLAEESSSEIGVYSTSRYKSETWHKIWMS